MAEMAYQVDYYIHIDSREAALALITHLPFNGNLIDSTEVADYAGPAIEQSINQVVQVTKMENINERIYEIREGVKGHLTEFLATFGILLNDLKVLIIPKDERMRELISLQAIGLSPSKLSATIWPSKWLTGSCLRAQCRRWAALLHRRSADGLLSTWSGDRIAHRSSGAHRGHRTYPPPLR